MGGKSRANVKVEANRQPVGLSKNTTGTSQGTRAAESEDAPIGAYNDTNYTGPRPKLSLKSKMIEYIESDQFPEMADAKDAKALLKKFPEEGKAFGLTNNPFFATMHNYPKKRLIKALQEKLPQTSVYKTLAPLTHQEIYKREDSLSDWKDQLNERYEALLDKNTKVEEVDKNEPITFSGTGVVPVESKKAFVVHTKSDSPLKEWSRDDGSEWLPIFMSSDPFLESYEPSDKKEAEKLRQQIIKDFSKTRSTDEKLKALNEEKFFEHSGPPKQSASNILGRSHYFNFKELSLHAGELHGFHHQDEHLGDIANLATVECFTRDVPITPLGIYQDVSTATGPLTKTLHLERLNSKATQFTRIKAELIAEAEGHTKDSASFEKRIKQLTNAPDALEKAQNKLAKEKKKTGYTDAQFEGISTWMWSVDNLMKTVVNNVPLIGTNHTFSRASNDPIEYTPYNKKILVDNGFIESDQPPTINSLIDNYLNDPQYLTNIKKSAAVKHGIISAKDLDVIQYLAEDYKNFPNLKRLAPVNPTGYITPYNYYTSDIKRITLLSLKALIQSAVKNGIKRITWEGYGQIVMGAQRITGNSAPFDFELFNEIIPVVAANYIKKFNGKLDNFSFTKEDETPSGEGNVGFNITPEMEKAVRENKLELV